jgi:hypothetical protein
LTQHASKCLSDSTDDARPIELDFGGHIIRAANPSVFSVPYSVLIFQEILKVVVKATNVFLQ